MFKKISLVVLVVIIVFLAFWFLKDNNEKEDLDNNQLSALEMMNNQDVQKSGDNKDAVVKGELEIPGVNIISAEQVVVTDMGTPVKADVMPNSPEAPKAVTIETKQLTEKMVQIKINDNIFSPSSFKVSAGEPVSLAFISGDKKTHVITFSDSSLAALAFGVSAGKVKAMSFNAPEKPGEYEFKCDIPGHTAQGYMIVE